MRRSKTWRSAVFAFVFGAFVGGGDDLVLFGLEFGFFLFEFGEGVFGEFVGVEELGDFEDALAEFGDLLVEFFYLGLFLLVKWHCKA